ncbi:hypothetical protein SAMD00019534_083230 [Acytostelium subglobosum LB1]|uniref:hypothetical protein n=1 Tax=Acytostelium subglobosum LB1 TaxID=1410327 RepID=UPI0006450FF2|nr:hypothetical protein SAMD00019534_083230 [Acytostelium subglobosum LB1]GAM25148.1 hypothetical protein SAMD00019534_083230 [Acytostelium subglobosum LB1]|eukprot:XP_012751668.1 hypothetical protein SAMD00019534_083230 [Acytostelium subglobosum LB1]
MMVKATQTTTSTSVTINYELYSLNKLFCINTATPNNKANAGTLGGKDKRHPANTFIHAKERSLSEQLGADGQAKPVSNLGVTIQLASHGGYDDHLFFALYCSNDYLILRYVGQSKVPQYKYIQWSKEPAKRIVSMAFDPTAQWLLCLQHDTSLVRIPIYFMMCKKLTLVEDKNTQQTTEKSLFSSFTSRFNKPNQPEAAKKPVHNIVSTPPLSKKTLIGSYCLWWKTSNSEDIAIVATTSGNIFFVNLSTNEVHRKIKLENHVTKIEIVTGSSETFLIISTKTMVHYQLVIEQQRGNSNQYESIVSPQNPNAKNTEQQSFQMITLFTNDRSTTERSLDKQDNMESGSIMASFIKSTAKLEIYDSLYLHKFPLFVYQLPQGTSSFYFTKNMTFVSEIEPHNDNAKMNVSIISNLVSGTVSNSKYMKNQSIIQTFQLAAGETAISITNSLESGGSNNDIAKRSNNNNNNSGNNIIMPSCYLMTNFAIYELRPKKSPEEIFFELVSKNLEKSDGEALGKTFRMDLLSLYETAADHAFDQGHYGRALDLYYLSGVKTSKLVYKFLEIGRMDIIMTHLKAILHQPEAFNSQEKKKMTNILFQCYLQKLLTSREEFKALDTEFAYFLSTNTDYDRESALQMLLQHGLLDYYFSVAHSGRLIGKALSSLLESNILHLDAQTISFLNGAYSLELKSNSGGMVFDCLSPDIQVKLILEDTQNIPRYLKRLFHLLPLLNEKSLMEIATTFDPMSFEPFNLTPSLSHKNSTGNSNNNMGNLVAVNGGGFPPSADSFETTSYLPGRSSESIPVRNEEYFELYINAILTLIYQRKHQYSVEDTRYDIFNIDSEAEVIEEQEEEPPAVTEDPDLLLVQMPPLMKNEKKAISVSCGWEHVAVISSDGELFTWGNNSQGQLGHGLSVGKFQTTPRRVETFKSSPIIIATCGGEHSIAVDQSFQIYSWGSSRHGQLGHGVLTPQNLPKKIEHFQDGQKVTAIAAGYAHTLILKKSGDLFSFGWNEAGQLGVNNLKSRAIPMRVETSEIVGVHGGKITQIACGHSHSVMCLENGDIYSWGSNTKGQLGHGNTEKQVRPKQIEELKGKPIIKISCGHFHTVVITELNSVFCWGQGEHMCLGIGSTNNVLSPKLVEFFVNKKVDRVVCGLFHTATVTAAESGSDRGNVYICGGGEHGKLGVGGDMRSPSMDKPCPAVIPSLNSMNIHAFSSGGEFSAIITSNGALYLWGHGNHGQIGNGKTDDIWIPTKVPLNDNRLALSSQNSKGMAKARFTQEGLEDILKAYSASYRPFFVINKAIHYENWDAAATIYDVMEDYKSTLECRLIGLKLRNLDKDKETAVLIQLLQNYIIKGSIYGIDSPPLISTSSTTTASPVQLSPPLFSTSPQLNSPQEIYPSGSQIIQQGGAPSATGNETTKKPMSPEKSKELLLLLILNYWREKDLPVSPLETFILGNIDSFSLPLSNILQMNVTKECPLVLDFSPSLYLIVVKYYLHFVKNLSDKERDQQRASEKVLLTNIKENLEKDISSRTKIQIHSLLPDTGMDALLHGAGASTFEKDVAFTCNHFFSKRHYFGTILPHFQEEVQKLGIPSATTLKYIMEEYNQKWISLSCPVCLYNFIRDLANDPLSKPWKV